MARGLARLVGAHAGAVSGRGGCRRALRRAVIEDGRESEHAAARAGRERGLRRLTRDEGAQCRLPLELAPRLGVQVNTRREAAGHDHGVAGDRVAGLDRLAADRAEHEARDPQLAGGSEYRGSAPHGDAKTRRLLEQGGIHVGTDIGDHGDAGTGRLQFKGGLVGRVVRGDDRNLLADANAVPVEVGSCRRGEQDPRQVIARKYQRPFDRTLGNQHLGGAHLPQPFPDRTLGGFVEVVGQLLVEANVVVREVAERGRATQQRDAGRRREFRERGGKPLGGGLAVDLGRRVGQQRTAKFGLLVAEDDRGTGGGGSPRRGDAGRARADDQHVAVRVAVAVAVGIGKARRPAEARGLADGGLVERLPGAFRPHEGLVVEARRNERREQRIDAALIDREARGAVLALGLESRVELDGRGAQVRRVARLVAPYPDQRVRFLGAGAKHAARPVVLERASHEVHAVGEQGRGQRVAGEARVAYAVELKLDDPRAVDTPARRGAKGAHGLPPASTGRGSPVR